MYDPILTLIELTYTLIENTYRYAIIEAVERFERGEIDNETMVNLLRQVQSNKINRHHVTNQAKYRKASMDLELKTLRKKKEKATLPKKKEG
jgi:hypothetical protein